MHVSLRTWRNSRGKPNNIRVACNVVRVLQGRGWISERVSSPVIEAKILCNAEYIGPSTTLDIYKWILYVSEYISREISHFRFIFLNFQFWFHRSKLPSREHPWSQGICNSNDFKFSCFITFSAVHFCLRSQLTLLHLVTLLEPTLWFAYDINHQRRPIHQQR